MDRGLNTDKFSATCSAMPCYSFHSKYKEELDKCSNKESSKQNFLTKHSCFLRGFAWGTLLNYSCHTIGGRSDDGQVRAKFQKYSELDIIGGRETC